MKFKEPHFAVLTLEAEFRYTSNQVVIAHVKTTIPQGEPQRNYHAYE